MLYRWAMMARNEDIRKPSPIVSFSNCSMDRPGLNAAGIMFHTLDELLTLVDQRVHELGVGQGLVRRRHSRPLGNTCFTFRFRTHRVSRMDWTQEMPV